MGTLQCQVVHRQRESMLCHYWRGMQCITDGQYDVKRGAWHGSINAGYASHDLQIKIIARLLFYICVVADIPCVHAFLAVSCGPHSNDYLPACRWSPGQAQFSIRT